MLRYVKSVWRNGFEGRVLFGLATAVFMLYFAGALIVLMGWRISLLPPRPVGQVTFATVEALLRHFAAVEYDLDAVRSGRPVPAIFLSRLPGDWPSLTPIEARKATFIKVLLPLVLAENRIILGQRRRLIALQSRGGAGQGGRGADMAAWLRRLAADYGVDMGDTVDFDALRRRVDVISPALAMAQAAVESAWGTSRFAMQGNALFGQWTGRRGAGLVPRNRPDGATYEVQAFPTLRQAVRAYMRNLNGHPAYRGFRSRRAAMRARGEALDGEALAALLQAYSQRGADYVSTLRAVMRVNRLAALDRARLATTAPPALRDQPLGM